MKPTRTHPKIDPVRRYCVGFRSNGPRIHSYCCALLLATSIALLVCGSPSVLAADSDFSKPIDVSADRSEYNERTNKQVLSGNVEIRQGTILITADEIDVILKDNKLNLIEGKGSPIKFQQQNDLGELITGSCERIRYDAVNGILTLEGNARLQQPKQRLSSDKIVFNSISQTVVAEGGSSGRVSITIQPPDRGN